MTNWSKHFKHENPDFSDTFRSLVQLMSDYFNVEVYATRLNFYPDSTAWKPFHHDSHAYGGKGKKEDFTIGASFGASRELVFLHPPSKSTFAFPQVNGDIFAFDTKINQVYQHGVPKAVGKTGPRFSIIAWGRRRSLNIRNGGTEEVDVGRINAMVKFKGRGNQQQQSEGGGESGKKKKKEVKVEVEQVTEMVEQFVLSKKPVVRGSQGEEGKLTADGPQRRKRAGGNRNQRIEAGGNRN